MNPLCEVVTQLYLCVGDFQKYSPLFTQFFRSLHNLVWTWVRKTVRGRPQEDFEDIIQDVFMQIYRVIQKGTPRLPTNEDRQLFSYLLVLTRRVAISYVRRLNDPACKFPAVAETLDADCLSAKESSLLKAVVDVELLWFAMSHLSPRDRACLTLCDLEGYTHVEAAGKLEISAANVGLHKLAARQHCREVLRQQFGIQDDDELWGILNESDRGFAQ